MCMECILDKQLREIFSTIVLCLEDKEASKLCWHPRGYNLIQRERQKMFLTSTRKPFIPHLASLSLRNLHSEFIQMSLVWCRWWDIQRSVQGRGHCVIVAQRYAGTMLHQGGNAGLHSAQESSPLRLLNGSPAHPTGSGEPWKAAFLCMCRSHA